MEEGSAVGDGVAAEGWEGAVDEAEAGTSGKRMNARNCDVDGDNVHHSSASE